MEVHDTLYADAWFPHALPELLRNVKQFVSSTPEHQSVTRCVFPECGSGFSEWHVVRLLKEACDVPLTEVVLMDTHIQGRWRDAWTSMAESAGVRLSVLPSYIELCDCAVSQDAADGNTLVLYIHGCFRFSPSTCPDPDHSRAAAIRFWKWCHTHVVNTPVNFLYGHPQSPGTCGTWLALAECHALH